MPRPSNRTARKTSPATHACRRPERSVRRPRQARGRASRCHPRGGARRILRPGFAAARLDDVARRAGVAKGTIYLYFADKETLFQELVRAMMSPVVGCHRGVAAADIPLRDVAERVVDMFVREMFGTRRKDVIRLILTEGPRFPAARRVLLPRSDLSRVMAAMRALLQRADRARRVAPRRAGEVSAIAGPAPALVAIIWNAMFDRFAPLDVARDDARASRHHSVRRRERDMTRAIRIGMLPRGRALALAGLQQGGDAVFQGWIEADLIFVSPDEHGRIETLTVREGDAVEKGAPLFTLDHDLQADDLEMRQGDARQRRARLRARAAAAQERIRHAEGLRRGAGGAARRAGAAGVGADPARAAQGLSPVDGVVQQIYFRPGETGAGRPADRLAPAARQHQGALLRAGSRCWRGLRIDDPVPSAATAARPRCRRRSASSRAAAEYTPPVIYSLRGAPQARLPGRGAPETAGRVCASVSRSTCDGDGDEAGK